jgi:predicted permease
MLAHLRHAFRLWRRTPVVSLTVILTLAIAIGANTAAFSVLRAVLLAPLPYPDAGRLAILWTEDPSHTVHQEGVSYPNYADWRSMNRTFADLAFFIRTDYSQVNVTGAETPVRIQSAEVSSNFFQVIGVPPAQGRAFSEQDLASRSHLVILGAGLAARRLGPVNPVGRSIEIDGHAETVIGIMPLGFHFPNADTEIWRPYTSRIPYQPVNRAADYLCVLGRLQPGSTIAAARANMAEVGKRIEQAHPNMPSGFSGFGVNVVPLYEHIYGARTRPALWLIAAVALSVLLIAVTNVANLLLARLETRDREFAVRMALGAGHGRLARQIVSEIGWLAAIGATLGIAVAFVGLRVLTGAFASRLPRLNQASLDLPMLGFALAITLGACLASALAPMSQLRRDMFASTIRRRSSVRLKRAFAITQVALATALMVSAGLLIRSYTLVERVPLGYQPDHLLVFELVTRASNLNSDSERDAYAARVARECRDRIRNLPGVLGVANAGDVFQRRNPDWEIYPEGRDSKPDGSPLADDIVTADFFRVLGAPLLSGRLFTREEERDPQRNAVIVNQSMARKYWPGIHPLGKRFSTSPPGSKPNWHTVIGVVGNMQMAARESGPIPQMYFATADYPDVKFVVRTASDPNHLLATIRSEVRSVDAGAVIYRPTTVEAQIDGWMGPRRMNTSVVGIFSAVAAVLAAIGIFSLLHYATAVRTREFGVRFALGATPSNVVAMVVRDGVSLAAIGAVTGAAGAIAAARAFQALLFAVQPWDAATLAASVAGALILAAAAALAPAIRAARLNPADALRSE